jgi:hypothetical protein
MLDNGRGDPALTLDYPGGQRRMSITRATLGGWCEAAYAGALCVGWRGSRGFLGRLELGSAGAGRGGSEW